MIRHISYSGLKEHAACPYRYKLIYVDKMRKFFGNEFTAFGTALHFVSERVVAAHNTKTDPGDLDQIFFNEFVKELRDIKKKSKEVTYDRQLLGEMKKQGPKLTPHILNALKEYFGDDFELVAIEAPLYEPMNSIGEASLKFKGFIDLVVHTPKDDKIHIVDYKSCSWGWDSRKRSDKMVTYQLTLYKHFFAERAQIDPKKIETHFCLMKRTAKKDFIEPFRVTSGPKKTSNALELLKNACSSVSSEFYPKNKLSCQGCPFFKKECK